LSDVDPRIRRREARRRQIRRRRVTAATVAGLVVAAFAAGVWAGRGPDESSAASAPGTTSTTETTSEAAEAAAPRPRKPSSRTTLRLRETLGGEITPKSVVSSGTGLVFAQNMMYRHSVTVYDSRTLELRKTISDSVQLADFGYEHYPGTTQGAPVEAAFSPDGEYAYVSNYSMYGEGLRTGGKRRVHPRFGLRPELRLQDLAGDPRDRRRLPGRLGPEGRGGHARWALRARGQLVHLGPQRRLDQARPRGEADTHGRVSARDRDLGAG
jgi:hypothetical protein